MVRFGPSGNSDKFYSDGNTDTIQAFKWLSEMGLSAFEYSFTLGRYLKQETAQKLGEEAKKYGWKTLYFSYRCTNEIHTRRSFEKFKAKLS